MNNGRTVALVYPLPNPNDPRQHEACCPLCKPTDLIFNFKFWMRPSINRRDCGAKAPVHWLNESTTKKSTVAAVSTMPECR